MLRGNLCPNGAVVKHSAMEPRFLKHSGKAVVFKDYEDLAARLDDPALDITADSIMVLQSAGPIGAPGMPEWGMLPLPKKLLEAGVRDVLRISDARMSGTSYGACILHVAPESAVGGPLALVRDGDVITLDVAARTLTLEVGDERTRETQGLMESRAPKGRSRLPPSLPQRSHAGRRRLRLPLPASHRHADAGAEDSLICQFRAASFGVCGMRTSGEGVRHLARLAASLAKKCCERKGLPPRSTFDGT